MIDSGTWNFSRTLQRGNAAEQILLDLKDQILQGRIPKGTRLPSEKELALHYGVSSPTVRNAMRGLVSARLIEVKHGSGASVTADTDDLIGNCLAAVVRRDRVKLHQTIEVLMALNGLAAELAAKTVVAEDLHAMQAALDEIDRSPDMPTAFEGLHLFFDRLARATGNPLLAALCRAMAVIQVAPIQDAASYKRWLENGPALRHGRQQIVNAIKSKKPEKARAAVKAYYDVALEIFGSFLDRALEDSPTVKSIAPLAWKAPKEKQKRV